MKTIQATGLALAMLVGLLAGCNSPSADPTTSQGPPAPYVPYALDCSISTWSQACLALASPNESPGKAEIDIAVNPTDPLNAFVASKDLDRQASADCVWAVGQVTFDGGRTWNTTYVGKKLADRTPADPLFGWLCITDPILQYEPDGTLHYSLQAYRYRPTGALPAQDPTGLVVPDGGNMYHAVSHDGGRTFTDFFLMHAGDSGLLLFHDYMRMGVNPQTGTIFTIWNQLSGFATSQPVLVAVESGAAAARPPVYFPQQVSPTGLGESGVVGAADGTVYAWLSGFNSGGNAVLATSMDDGRTFDEPKLVWTFQAMNGLDSHPCSQCPQYDDADYCPSDAGEYTPCYRTGTAVELAVDTSPSPQQGCLYAVWAGRELVEETSDPSDIVARTSCDKGLTWSEPVLVSAGPRADGQWMPRVSVDGIGTIHVVYYTRAYDPEHNLIDAEHAYSMDGGRNWTQVRLTDVSFDGNLGLHQDGFPFIGDYIGISSTGTHTYMAFPVTQTGRAEIAVAHATFQPQGDCESHGGVSVSVTAGPDGASTVVCGDRVEVEANAGTPKP